MINIYSMQCIAADRIDDFGSIEIQLENTEESASKEGVVFCVEQVAESVGGEYIIFDDFKAADVDFQNIQTAKELEDAAIRFLPMSKGETTIRTNEEGIASIRDLSVGLYLVYVVEPGEYESIVPFLVSIPTWDEVENQMRYDVVICPKHTAAPEFVPIPVKTGDDSHSMLYSILLLMSAFLGIYVKKLYRRNR